MSTPMVATREALGDMPNPLGLQGIEFIEYATSRPQALGQALERMGFQPVARHRSREVLLYRQGDMNTIVNAHQDTERTGVHAPPALTETPVLAAIAFRVGNAAAAFRRVLELGAWAVHTEVEVMEIVEEPAYEASEPEPEPFWPVSEAIGETSEEEPVAESEEELEPEPVVSVNGGSHHHEGPSKTLEDSIKDMLRPMLREWLDENMPRIVREMDPDALRRHYD